jgi:hypothetical protein
VEEMLPSTQCVSPLGSLLNDNHFHYLSMIRSYHSNGAFIILAGLCFTAFPLSDAGRLTAPTGHGGGGQALGVLPLIYPHSPTQPGKKKVSIAQSVVQQRFA